MEMETIDLTDPLQELLRRTGWTPEEVFQRLEKLKEDAKKNRNPEVNSADSDCMPRLDDETDDKSKIHLEMETIELSDDDTEQINTVVIEIEDDDDSHASTKQKDGDHISVRESVGGLCENESKKIIEDIVYFDLNNIETPQDSNNDKNSDSSSAKDLYHDTAEGIFQKVGDNNEESNTIDCLDNTSHEKTAVSDTSKNCSLLPKIDDKDMSCNSTLSELDERKEKKTKTNPDIGQRSLTPETCIFEKEILSPIIQHKVDFGNWENVDNKHHDGIATDDRKSHEATDPELLLEGKDLENAPSIGHTVGFFNDFDGDGLGLLISSVRGGVELDETDEPPSVTDMSNSLEHQSNEESTLPESNHKIKKNTNANPEKTCNPLKENSGFVIQEATALGSASNEHRFRKNIDDYKENKNAGSSDPKSTLLEVKVTETTSVNDFGLLISSVRGGVQLDETDEQTTATQHLCIGVESSSSFVQQASNEETTILKINQGKEKKTANENSLFLSKETCEFGNRESVDNEHTDIRVIDNHKENENSGPTDSELSLMDSITSFVRGRVELDQISKRETLNSTVSHIQGLSTENTEFSTSLTEDVDKKTNFFAELNTSSSSSSKLKSSFSSSLTNELITPPKDFEDITEDGKLKNVKYTPDKHTENGDTSDCGLKYEKVELNQLQAKKNVENIANPESYLLATNLDNTADQNSDMIIVNPLNPSLRPNNELSVKLKPNPICDNFGHVGKKAATQLGEVLTNTSKQDGHLFLIKETTFLQCHSGSGTVKSSTVQDTPCTRTASKSETHKEAPTNFIDPNCFENSANIPKISNSERSVDEFGKCAGTAVLSDPPKKSSDSGIDLDKGRKNLNRRLTDLKAFENKRISSVVSETATKPIENLSSTEEASSLDVSNVIEETMNFELRTCKQTMKTDIEDNYGKTNENTSERKQYDTVKTEDHRSETASSKYMDSEDEEGEPKLNFEEIRKNLKMQLTSLRTRKNMGVLPVVPDNKHQSDNIWKNKLLHDNDGFLQRKLRAADHKGLIEESVGVKTLNEGLIEPIKSDVPSIQPNEFSFIITSINTIAVNDQLRDVCPEKNDNPVRENLEEGANDGIPNVLSEIRKIINKQKATVSSGIYENLKRQVFNPAPEYKELNTDTSREVQQETYPIVNKHDAGDSKTDGNSPFVSDSLDEFLTENSRLNVSYVVPKSGAEEGLRKNYYEELVVPISVPTGSAKEEQQHLERPKLEMPKFKAKTLAEKRKMFERNKRRELKELKRMKKINDEQERSYVLFENKKIWVQSEEKSKCFAEIDSDLDHRTFSKHTPRKLSLLDDLKRRKHVVKYKAGPLCKKPKLQEEDSMWKSEVKTLPKITLEIQPETGKPVWPGLLHLLPCYDGEVTEDQIDFALTALVANGCASDKKIFKFDVPYANNQEKILIKKRIDPASSPIIPPHLLESKQGTSCEIQVASVVEDLLKFVELKEIAPSLIKEDEDCFSHDSVWVKEKPNDAGHLLVKRRRSKKRSKTDLELNRLSCKIVSVEVEDSPNEGCNKPYCALGCVCNSLSCETFIGMHCRKVECMFGCNCPQEKGLSLYHEKINLPMGSNVLSTDTVSRIEDAAKRNLAKVEREFTQTVIHTSHKTIIVGSNKPRRATRTPKKYTDFFDDSDDDSKAEARSVTNLSHQMVPCRVEIQKFDFTGLKPFCIIHNLYDCHCNLTDTFPVYEPIVTAEDPLDLKDVKNEEAKVTRKRHNRSTLKKYTPDAEGAPLPKTKKLEPPEPSNCARTKVAKYKKARRLSDTVFNNDFIRNITEADLLKARLSSKKKPTECESLKLALIANEQQKVEETGRKVKRKQLLEVREECQSKLRKIGKVEPSNRTCRPVFDGEIIVNDKEWVEKFGATGKQHVGGYARILPWKALLVGYLSKKIHVYCFTDSPYKLLITSKGRVLENALNVETHAALILSLPMKTKSPWLVSQCDNVKDIVRWLMTCTLPEKYNMVSLSILLVETEKDMFEVKGLCTQNLTPELQKPSDESDDAHQLVKHRDMHNNVKTLKLTKERFPLQELMPEKKDFVNSSEAMYMWVGLPKVHDFCKWRVVPLNGDFAYLHFKKVNYSVKYTDLIKFSEMAKEALCTLVIRNEQIANGHSHSQFGLYIDQSYSDRVFVGPYFKQCQEEDVETLRYINRSLVSCECFNKMRGNNSYQCGSWMTERVQKSPKRYVKATIDLTIDDDNVENDEEPKPDTFGKRTDVKQRSDSPLMLGNTNQVIFHNNIAIHIKNAKPKSPSEYNRYIITNIPRFGYLGAYQPDNSHVLEVSWPFEKKVLQFENADHARDFLQERFNQLLQPVPETFKIQVIVLVDLDLNEYKPINSDFLSGHCICGFFGTYNFRNLSEKFCLRVLKISKGEITKMFAKRAHAYVRKRVEELALVIGMKQEDIPTCTLDLVLETAVNQIKTLDETKKQNITTIKNLEKGVVEKIKVLYELMHNLPSKERNIESQVFNEILKIRPDRFISRETVEIEDDDAGSSNAQSDSNFITSPVSSHTGIEITTFSDQNHVDTKKNRIQKSKAKSEGKQNTVKSLKLFKPRALDSISSTKIDKAEKIKIAKVAPFQSASTSTQSAILRPGVPKLPILDPVYQKTRVSQSEGDAPDISLPDVNPPCQEPNMSPLAHTLDVVSPKGTVVKGMKVLKTSEGKFLLVTDGLKNLPGPHKKVIIKNNRVYAKTNGDPEVHRVNN